MKKSIIIALIVIVVAAIGGIGVYTMQEQAQQNLIKANEKHSLLMENSKKLQGMDLNQESIKILENSNQLQIEEANYLKAVLNNPLANGDQKELAKLMMDVNTGNSRISMYQIEMVKEYLAGNFDTAMGALNRATEESKVCTEAANKRDSFLASHNIGIEVVKK